MHVTVGMVTICLASAMLFDTDFTFSDLPATLSDLHDPSDPDPRHGEFVLRVREKSEPIRKQHFSLKVNGGS